MAKKKEKLIEEKQDSIPFISVDGIERLCLAKEHLLEAEMMNFEIASYVEAIRARTIEAAKIEQEAVIRSSQLKQEANFLNDKRNIAIDRRKKFFGKLNDVYKIDFAKATYDSETGIITVEHDKNDAVKKQQIRSEREQVN
jgi:hypothetical protein